MKIHSTFLRSKVARRIFVLFVASALVPIGMLALLSFDQVISQLVEHSYQQLHRDSKAVAMTVFERLSITESELKLLGGQHGARAESLVSLPDQSHQRLRQRFVALRVETPGGAHQSLLGDMDESSEFSESQIKYLRDGKAVVWSRIDHGRD